MSWTTKLKNFTNRGLHKANLHMGSYTRERMELDRLGALARWGHFDRPVFPVPTVMRNADPCPILQAVSEHRGRFNDFCAPERNSTGFSFQNDYFSSPDAEVLYSIVRMYRPRRVIEVGCGNSTRVTRLAVRDGRLTTCLWAVDPSPRAEIQALCDEIYSMPAETLSQELFLAGLVANDILFIDSSHEVKPGNDMLFLYFQVLPRLPSGVLVHIHDVFLPYEYPRDWVVRWRWEWQEQYLVQAILYFSDAFEVVWPGYYLQRTMPEFARHFPHHGGRNAQSLWLRRR